jgi:hypothetical protein
LVSQEDGANHEQASAFNHEHVRAQPCRPVETLTLNPQDGTDHHGHGQSLNGFDVAQ